MRFVIYTTDEGMDQVNFLKIFEFDETDAAACTPVEQYIDQVYPARGSPLTLTAAKLDAQNNILDFDVFKNIMGDWISEQFSRMTREKHDMLRTIRDALIKQWWEDARHSLLAAL